MVKENLSSSGEVELDDDDRSYQHFFNYLSFSLLLILCFPICSSVTRSESLLKSLFEKSGLVIIKEMVQLKFPKEIYPVKMFALRGKTDQ